MEEVVVDVEEERKVGRGSGSIYNDPKVDCAALNVSRKLNFTSSIRWNFTSKADEQALIGSTEVTLLGRSPRHSCYKA